MNQDGALYQVEGEMTEDDEWEATLFVSNGNWKIGVLNETLSEDMTYFIVNNIKPASGEKADQAWWTGSSTGLFICKSAYHIVRAKS